MPVELLKQLRAEVHAALMALPFVRRTPQFTVMVKSTAVYWEKSASAEVVLTPAAIPRNRVGSWQCSSLPAWVQRSQGHVVCRERQKISWCRELSGVVGESSLQTGT